MTLICKPRGRGNWHAITLTVKAQGVDLFPSLRLRALRVGETITIGGGKSTRPLVLRICEVRP